MSAGALVVNADDLGISKGATLGVVRAHREGIVTSASLAATTPYYEHALENCVRACPELGIGLHFTLTSGRPLSPASRVPLLVDRRGFFRWRFLPLLAAVAAGAPRGLLGQIELELEAQLERLSRDGVRPDHIDGERHVHLIPGIFDLVAAAARRRDIPFLRLGRDIGPRHARGAERLRLTLGGGSTKSWLLSRLADLDRPRLPGGIRYAEHVASYLYTGRLDLLLPALLKSAPPDDTLEIMVHPGVPEESRNADLGNPELERYLSSEDRRRELEACVAARGRTDGWRLATFGQLARERLRDP
ncbi:MAG TPA: ChbG/HpnK family deacetylase [Elusimicrobiota bacterium]|nr:ChbG/HpnK family deacetylase [Elusimicrobiota bacterium]